MPIAAATAAGPSLTTATAARGEGGAGRADGPGTETTPAAAAPGGGSAAIAAAALAFYDGPPPGSPPKRSFTSRSRIPPECSGNVPCAVGVDEAGRGPVLGARAFSPSARVLVVVVVVVGGGDGLNVGAEEDGASAPATLLLIKHARSPKQSAGGSVFFSPDHDHRRFTLFPFAMADPGPMVYGMCYCPVSRMEDLARLGFAGGKVGSRWTFDCGDLTELARSRQSDSKILKEEQRSSLFGVIKEHAASYIGYATRALVPQDISESMLRRSKCNLNLIAHNATIELIRDALVSGLNVAEIYVDTVGGPESYQAKLSATFPGVRVTVAKKADAKYPVVSAASIAAKVTRDEVLRNWIFEEDRRPPRGAESPGGAAAGRAEASPPPEKFSTGFGSGYPSGTWEGVGCRGPPWSHPVFGYPSLIRFSWMTAERLLEQSAVKVTWSDYEKAAEWGTAGGGNVADMFAKSGDGARKARKVFGDLGLKRVSQF
ncbi:MAG: ribonuclease H-like domain-containing protein [Olpidium bornovanus]|uniref:Ribonuclease n=1 Tax=Olpidium bornovanus TaxID=278681 RepID=A0A8H7ZYG0_9FUNG|nr:MAG: ribonuclease H-like domain-containing protein [Olpidium bornovanus]